MLMDRTLVVEVSASIAGLFARLPMLEGFSVQEQATLDRDNVPLAHDLCIADLSLDAWAGAGAQPVVREEIVQALRQLLDEHPGSYEVLRGHAFARTFH
jgi:hypothetical protein